MRVMFTILLLATFSSAQTTVWGITLGKPTDLPTCEGYTAGAIMAENDNACETEPFQFEDAPYNHSTLYLLTGKEKRQWVVDGYKIGGNVEQMSMDMALICDEFLSGLKERFGQPSTVSKSQYKTGLGVPITVTTLVWNRKGGDHVSFSVPYPKIDECEVVANTLKWRSQKQRKLKF